MRAEALLRLVIDGELMNATEAEVLTLHSMQFIVNVWYLRKNGSFFDRTVAYCK